MIIQRGLIYDNKQNIIIPNLPKDLGMPWNPPKPGEGVEGFTQIPWRNPARAPQEQAILTGWPLFYCDATSLNGSRPTEASGSVLRCAVPHRLQTVHVPRTRINLST